MKTIAKLLAGATLAMTMLVPCVQADFYVIPVNKKVKNVITVAKSGGQFTDVKAAVDSISDASATNPYLIYIAPGVYTITEQIVMKSYVSISGSGEDTTQLEGAIAGATTSSGAIIKTAAYATVSELAIKNTGGSADFGVGVYSNSDEFNLKNVSIVCSGAVYNIGIATSHVTGTNVMDGITARATGGTISVGITNENGSPTMKNINASASSATDNYGVYNITSSSPDMSQVKASCYGGNDCYGILNDVSSSPKMNFITATATNGATKNYGICNAQDSNPTIENATADGLGLSSSFGVYNYQSSPTIKYSTLSGSQYGLYNSDSFPSVSFSTIIGSLSETYNFSGSIPKCVYTVDNLNADLNSTCE